MNCYARTSWGAAVLRPYMRLFRFGMNRVYTPRFFAKSEYVEWNVGFTTFEKGTLLKECAGDLFCACYAASGFAYCSTIDEKACPKMERAAGLAAARTISRELYYHHHTPGVKYLFGPQGDDRIDSSCASSWNRARR